MRFNLSRSYIFLVTAVVLVLLCGGLFFVWRVVGIPEMYYKDALLVTSFFVVALITVTTYQSMKIYDSANRLAKDITEDFLQYSHELFTELYRSSPVPYLVIDARGDVVSMNIATARLFNTELNALEGINIFQFFEDDESHKDELIPEYFKEGKAVSDIELKAVLPDKTNRWVRLSLFSFTDTNKEKRGLLTLVDVTKQKMIDKAKTEFVSLASHQLRTPISGMKWNIELLATAGKETFDKTHRKYLDKISGGIERMETLINDFLSASKFELGTLEPEYTELKLNPFFQKIHDELAPMAEEKGIRIEVEYDDDLGTAHTDEHMLHHITSNLLSNAIKYTPQSGVVKFGATRGKNTMTLKISDTGIGIPLEDQEMIFSKMFRASNARTRVTDGTGLGLYIVKESVTILGGKITFVSEKDKGTEFTVTLPA